MQKWTTGFVLLTALFAVFFHRQLGMIRGMFTSPPVSVAVAPSLETEPVLSSGDAADDVSIWVHPDHPEKSLVFASDKKTGILVYNLQGKLVAYFPEGRTNNLDLRYNFPLGERRVDILVANERHNDVLKVFEIVPDIPAIRQIDQQPIATGIEVYGLGLYHDPAQDRFFAFVTSKSGTIKQIELLSNGEGKVVGREVRQIQLPGVVEGTVADDQLGWVYFAEEEHAVWRFPAHPDSGNTGQVVDTVRKGGPLQPDIEGLALYRLPDGEGYLVATCQGSSSFAVYDRRPPHRFHLTFRVIPGNGIDGVSGTDGIEITSAPLEPWFPAGLMVVQDNENEPNQNFKYISWAELVKASAGRLHQVNEAEENGLTEELFHAIGRDL